MCRMLAARAPSGADVAPLLRRFRSQAVRTERGPEAERRHADGWGVAACGSGGERLLLRRPVDASKDPVYERMVDVVAGFDAPLVLIHLRNASVGKTRRENTHPFVSRPWAFMHNGTIRDPSRLQMVGVKALGDTDSEQYFRRVLVRLKRGSSPALALRQEAGAIGRLTPYTSLTCLLTDGASLYAMRELGTDLSDSGTPECQSEYYGLAIAKQGPVTLLAQEPTHLGTMERWTEVPQGAVLTWPPHEAPTVEVGMVAASNGGHAPSRTAPARGTPLRRSPGRA